MQMINDGKIIEPAVVFHGPAPAGLRRSFHLQNMWHQNKYKTYILMKILLLLSSILLLTVSADQCGKKKTDSRTYKAKLEIKGICMNYTLRLLEGNIDSTLITSTWTDESTGKSYNNVFALGSRCTFPADLEQGDDFYFMIDTTTKQQCAVCMAYYPTPPRKLSIKVVEK
jgi:hypothetical protein